MSISFGHGDDSLVGHGITDTEDLSFFSFTGRRIRNQTSSNWWLSLAHLDYEIKSMIHDLSLL